MDPKKLEKGRELCLLTIDVRLNRGSAVCSIPIKPCLHVLEYAASFMWQSCNSKRAGSHINSGKTLQRIMLNLDPFNSLVFGSFNNAPVHKPDTPCLVSKWRADGSLTGTAL